MGATVTLAGVTKSYDRDPGRQGPRVLDGLDLSFRPGEICALYGPNGAGKSTLLRLAARLDPPDRGEVSVTPDDARIAFVWQNFQDSLFPWLTVAENIALAGKLEGLPPAEVLDQAAAAAQTLGVDLPLHKYGSQLSGGQMQMTAIARMLASAPDCAFLDEPFSALDEKRRRLCMSNARAWLAERSVCTALVSHSLDEAILFADRLLVLSPSPMRVLDDIAIALPSARNYELVLDSAFNEVRSRALKSSASWA